MIGQPYRVFSGVSENGKPQQFNGESRLQPKAVLFPIDAKVLNRAASGRCGWPRSLRWSGANPTGGSSSSRCQAIQARQSQPKKAQDLSRLRHPRHTRKTAGNEGLRETFVRPLYPAECVLAKPVRAFPVSPLRSPYFLLAAFAILRCRHPPNFRLQLHVRWRFRWQF